MFPMSTLSLPLFVAVLFVFNRAVLLVAVVVEELLCLPHFALPDVLEPLFFGA